MEKFNQICETIYSDFESKWNNSPTLLAEVNNKLKRALQGDIEAEEYFKKNVYDFLKQNVLMNEAYPEYYSSMVDAVYHENWGMAGMAEWFTEKYSMSSSAKIIGDRIYFLDNGETKLMPQTMPAGRRKRFVAKLLTIKPDERKDKDVNEIYLKDGTRVTIYNQSACKASEDIVVFRRYVLAEYTFEEQSRRETIPEYAIPLFMKMIKLGYNVAFTGAVRVGKSSFLATWQRYEDPSLEGLLIETDPEIPIHHIMPNAPIMQIVADNDRLKEIIKNLMRSDAEYMIMAEARDGIALDAAIRVANKGTRRCKMTFHNRNPIDFVYDVASEIVRTEGGNLGYIAEKTSQSVDYIFHFIQLQNKSHKRLDSIHELRYDRDRELVVTTTICKYDKNSHSWNWNYAIGPDKEEMGLKEDRETFLAFQEELKEIAEHHPILNENVVFEKAYKRG